MSRFYNFIDQFGDRCLLFAKTEKYRTGEVKIVLYDSKDGMPYSTATTLIESELHPGEVAIKDWSENEGMLNFLVENSFVEKPHRFVEQGYVKVPICKLIQ